MTPSIQKAKTRAGCVLQIIAGIIWFGCGLATNIFIFGLIAGAAGTWVAVIGFVFFPVLYGFAPLIHWLITGTFPLLYLVIWLVGWGAALIFYLGSRLTGEES